MARGAALAIVAGLCLLAAGGIVALIVADTYFIEVNLLYTVAALVLFGVAAVAAVVCTSGTSLAWLGWLCAFVGVIGFGLFMGYVWSIDEFADENQGLGKASGTLFLFTYALSDVCLMLRATRGRAITGIIVLTSIAIGAIATLLSIALIGDTGGETYFRVVSVIAVLWALGTALVPVLRASEP